MSNKDKCEACENGMEAFMARERELMEKYGWVMHLVAPEHEGGSLNVHTHGILESFDHPDLQMLLPFNLNQNTIQNIFNNLVDKIRNKEQLTEGLILEGVVKPPFEVTFCERTECGRKVIRVILPDAKGELQEDKQEYPFNLQWSKDE